MKIPTTPFAQACIDNNSVSDLEQALRGAADEADCSAWSITPIEWREQAEAALAYLKNRDE